MKRKTDRAAFAHGQGDLRLGAKFARPRAEQELVNTIGEWAMLHGHFPIRLNNGAAKIKGQLVRFVRFFGLRPDPDADVIPAPPDMLIQHRDTGVWVMLECKDGRGVMSDGQRKMQREVRKRGGIFEECRCLADAEWAMKLASEQSNQTKENTDGQEEELQDSGAQQEAPSE